MNATELKKEFNEIIEKLKNKGTIKTRFSDVFIQLLDIETDDLMKIISEEYPDFTDKLNEMSNEILEDVIYDDKNLDEFIDCPILYEFLYDHISWFITNAFMDFVFDIEDWNSNEDLLAKALKIDIDTSTNLLKNYGIKL